MLETYSPAHTPETAGEKYKRVLAEFVELAVPSARQLGECATGEGVQFSRLAVHDPYTDRHYHLTYCEIVSPHAYDDATTDALWLHKDETTVDFLLHSSTIIDPNKSIAGPPASEMRAIAELLEQPLGARLAEISQQLVADSPWRTPVRLARESGSRNKSERTWTMETPNRKYTIRQTGRRHLGEVVLRGDAALELSVQTADKLTGQWQPTITYAMDITTGDVQEAGVSGSQEIGRSKTGRLALLCDLLSQQISPNAVQ